MCNRRLLALPDNLICPFGRLQPPPIKRKETTDNRQRPRRPSVTRSHLLDGSGGEQRTHAQAERLQHTAPLPDSPQAGVRKACAVGDVQVAQPPAARLQSLRICSREVNTRLRLRTRESKGASRLFILLRQRFGLACGERQKTCRPATCRCNRSSARLHSKSHYKNTTIPPCAVLFPEKQGHAHPYAQRTSFRSSYPTGYRDGKTLRATRNFGG